MQKKKYGIWKTRYAENSRNIFEDWVRRNGFPRREEHWNICTVWK